MNRRKCLLLFLIFGSVLCSLYDAVAQEISETPAPSSSPTRTHIPKDIRFLSLVQALTQENEDCELPCFWGLQPGRTTLAEAQTFTRDNFGRDLISGDVTTSEGVTYGSILLDLLPSGSDYAVVMALTFEDGVLSVLEVHLHGLQEWLPDSRFRPSVLLDGLPVFPDVYLGVNVSTGLVDMLVVDNGNGVMVRYTFPLAAEGNRISPNLNNSLLLCPTAEVTESITLWLQDMDADADAPMQGLMSNPTLATKIVNYYLSVEWMTGLSNRSFVEQFVGNPGDCIEMLSYRELSKRGYNW